MFAAFLASTLFAFSVVFASRTTRVLGGLKANLYRLILAAVLLGLYAHALGGGLRGGGLWWFFLSGCIGFGLGDLALYLSLPRVGPRLAGLLVQCLAPPFAAVAEWLWIGTTPTTRELCAGAIILAGVALAVAPDRRVGNHHSALPWGITFGVIAALGQGLGAVVSRKAFLAAELSGFQVDGLTSAYQRILGGLVIAIPATLLFLARQRTQPPPPHRSTRHEPSQDSAKHLTPLRWALVPVWVWVLANALAGPALGVGCYQWALATTPSAVVLPIVATMPILVIPLAWWLERDRPSLRALLGGAVAVTGAVLMALPH